MTKQLLLLSGLLFLSVSTIEARSEIEGIWESISEQGTTVEIVNHRNGIRVKSVYDNQWDFYRKRNRREYWDPQGRIFEITRSGELYWREHYSDRWPIRFRRSINYNDPYNYELPYDNQDPYYDDYYDRNNRKDEAFGTWESRQTDERLVISNFNAGLAVRTNGNRYNQSNYRQINASTFVNRNGDSIEIVDQNRLVWRSNDGRYRYSFYRARNRNPDRNRCPSGWD